MANKASCFISSFSHGPIRKQVGRKQMSGLAFPVAGKAFRAGAENLGGE
jgi:hypothetical protein